LERHILLPRPPLTASGDSLFSHTPTLELTPSGARCVNSEFLKNAITSIRLPAGLFACRSPTQAPPDGTLSVRQVTSSGTGYTKPAASYSMKLSFADSCARLTRGF